ncbi:MAG TPA: TonB family protein [Thermoanaerobaculia bacterium]|jgi:protein TonB|nr:TonB family protein [Thermoanaerobaculia bacterium]
MRSLRSTAAALGLVAALPAIAAPARAQVPAAQQATTFDKIFGFDRALADRSKLRVLLVFDPGTAGSKDAAAPLQRAFGAAGMTAESVAVGAAAAKLRPGVVAYLLPGATSADFLKAAAAAHVLTVAGDTALAEQGRASVGLAQRGDKTDIVVNLDRLAAEGHDFAAQLLNFARVVRSGGAAAAATGAGGGAAAPAAEEAAKPVLVSITKPDYPSLGRRFKIQGDVVMRLSVDESGRVTHVELVKGLGKGGLDEAAMGAAQKARFRPASRNGVAVASTYVLVMPFRL